MKRETLEKYQVVVYLVAISLGLVFGIISPTHTGLLEQLLWPVLGLLLYTTFTQVPLSRLRQAFTHRRFMMAAVVGNFVILPLVVWGLMTLGPDIPAVQLGILLVLLLPCTDWFITFTHLGGGDTGSAVAFSPVSLLLQLLLLPVYLWLFLGSDLAASVIQRELVMAFFGLIVLPLAAAFFTEKWVGQRVGRERLLVRLGWLPVPLLALVVIVFQSLVELMGMAIYLWWVPEKLHPLHYPKNRG